MFKLSNDQLSITILDPRHDQPYLGSRYCSGGYIWQVEDHLAGPLLTGPQYPAETPEQFHGQGAPEAFVTPLGSGDVQVGEAVTMIGVGEVVRSSTVTPFHVRDNPAVRRFCKWTVGAGADHIRMVTEQAAEEHAVTLVRSVILDGRTVISRSEICNRSAVPVPIRWFPHPFFPPSPRGICTTLGFEWSLDENEGYFRDGEGVLRMKPEYPWEKGLFQQLQIPRGVRLEAHVRHPSLDRVVLTSDYPLESLPVWSNRAAFSPEPHMACSVAPGERCEWNITYRFER